MTKLSRSLRRQLERTVVNARQVLRSVHPQTVSGPGFSGPTAHSSSAS